MNKSELIEKVIEVAKEKFEKNIPEHFTNFDILDYDLASGVINFISWDTKNEDENKSSIIINVFL